MSGDKPTLTQLTLQRHFWAATLTLLLLLVGVLLFTDLTVMYARRHTLAEQLIAVESVNDTLLPLLDAGHRPQDQGHAGTRLLNTRGYWQVAGAQGVRLSPRPWEQAAAVMHAPEQAMHGMGYLPWLKDRVIWAARVISAPTGKPQILVAWERVDAIRMVKAPLYIVMIITTLIAFGVSIWLALRTVRNVRGVLDDIADSSSRMAAGDFHVQLAPQPAQELDRVTTSLNQLARELDRATSALQEEHARIMRLEQMQRQFVADASHELRSPLTSMRVTMEAWQDGVLRTEEHGAALAQMQRETQRLAELVLRLLDLSRIESGRETLTSEPVAVAAVAYAVAAGFAGLPGAPVIVDVPETLPPVQADRDALRRIMQNLVENARRFTPDDGEIRVWAEVDGPVMRVGVSDTGTGINPEFLPRIWDRFARAPEARAAGRAGSGLGLSIVKALTEEMGGTVDAHSAPGAGATILVTIPLAIAPTAA